MVVWAVTGPAGGGKTAVSEMLAARGAAIVAGDRLGHEVLSWPDVQAEIVQRIGAGYVTGQQVDRAALGERVFGDPRALAELNQITHTRLARLAAEKLAALAAAGEHELAVFEAAVYFLLPSPPRVDLVLAVVAPPEIRMRRLIQRSAGLLTEAQARRRIEAQRDLDQHWLRADEIIVNDGTREELEARVLRFWPGPQRGRETQS
jgi:dephospho-CoA kinase